MRWGREDIAIGLIATPGAGCFAWTRFFAPERGKAGSVKELRSARRTEAGKDLQAASTPYDRWCALTEVVLCEADASPAAQVKAHAAELLRLSPGYRRDWNYGNAVHKANLALGRVALREGDRAGAKRYLIEAGKTPGSPRLNSFGPNMLLAKELFAAGERQAILEYFALCDRFREMGHDQLRGWSALVKDGVEPDFGANLLY